MRQLVGRHPVAIGAVGAILGLSAGLLGTAHAVNNPAAPTAAVTDSPTPGGSGGSPGAGLPGGPDGPGGPGGPGHHRGHRFGGGGTLTAVSPSSITYASPDGTSHTAALNGSTTYRKDGDPAKQSDLAVGQHVMVRLVDPAAASPTAAMVAIHSPQLFGIVSSADGSTIVVVDPEGFRRTIHTNSATTYTNNGQAATESAVTVGQPAHGIGSIDANGTDLDASRVDVGRPPRGPDGPGRWGKGD